MSCDSCLLRQGRGGIQFARAFSRLQSEASRDGTPRILPDSVRARDMLFSGVASYAHSDLKGLASPHRVRGKFNFSVCCALDLRTFLPLPLIPCFQIVAEELMRCAEFSGNGSQ
jgi:hypothetical protein